MNTHKHHAERMAELGVPSVKDINGYYHMISVVHFSPGMNYKDNNHETFHFCFFIYLNKIFG